VRGTTTLPEDELSVFSTALIVLSITHIRLSGWFVLVMPIDDITIAARVDDIDGLPVGMLPLSRAPGTPEKFGVARRGGSVYVTYAPVTRVVTARVSVPRWLHANPVNFPLVGTRSVEQLRPHRISQEIAQALGLRLSSLGTELDDHLPIRRWSVIRASYAVDLEVKDPVRVVQGCMGIQRRNSGLFKCFGRPRITTAEWSSRGLSSKVYAKGPELASRRSVNETTNETVNALAEDAEHVLRFEVTFKQVNAIRSLFGRGLRGGLLPTFSLMCDPRIEAWVLTREAVRLRLNEHYDGLERTTLPLHVRHVVNSLKATQAEIADGSRTLGRRKCKLTQERFNRLVSTYIYASAFSVPEVADLLDCSVSTVRELVSELREAGVPPDASPFTTLGAAVQELVEQLEPHLLNEYPPDLTDWRGRGAFVPAPWSETPIDENDLVSDIGDEPVEEMNLAWLEALLDEHGVVQDIGLIDPATMATSPA
jgi:hypothetical protein